MADGMRTPDHGNGAVFDISLFAARTIAMASNDAPAKCQQAHCVDTVNVGSCGFCRVHCPLARPSAKKRARNRISYMTSTNGTANARRRDVCSHPGDEVAPNSPLPLSSAAAGVQPADDGGHEDGGSGGVSFLDILNRTVAVTETADEEVRPESWLQQQYIDHTKYLNASEGQFSTNLGPMFSHGPLTSFTHLDVAAGAGITSWRRVQVAHGVFLVRGYLGLNPGGRPCFARSWNAQAVFEVQCTDGVATFIYCRSVYSFC